MTLIKRILGLFTLALAITYFVMSPSEEPKGLFIALGVLMIVFTILLFFPTKKDKQRKEERQKKAISNRIDKNNKNLKPCIMKHINGLPIAENVNCNVSMTDNKFLFSSGAMNFELEKSKITDICIKTDTEIQKQYVSSIGGAVGGAVLFGPLGAMIGGRAKKKTVKNEIHSYLIITYQSPEIKYIGFDVGHNFSIAKAYVNDFKNNHTTEETYQL